MGLNTIYILGGVLSMALIAISGVAYSPEKTTEILGFCGMITGTLLLMLKTDQDTRRLNRRIDASDVKTESVAAEVKEAVQQKGTEVKQALRIADAAKKEQLTDIAVAVKAVEKKLNGSLDRRFDSMEEKIEAVVPKVIEEVVKNPLPGISPGSEK